MARTVVTVRWADFSMRSGPASCQPTAARTGLSLSRQEGTRAERVQRRATRVWIVNKDRKKIVILMFEMAADGFSASEIANHLNSDKVKTFTETPLWKRHQVQWILKNEAVVG